MWSPTAASADWERRESRKGSAEDSPKSHYSGQSALIQIVEVRTRMQGLGGTESEQDADASIPLGQGNGREGSHSSVFVADTSKDGVTAASDIRSAWGVDTEAGE